MIKDWAEFSHPDGPTGSKDLVGVTNRYSEDRIFAGRKMAFVHRFPEGSVWVIDPIDGTNTVTQKEDFAVMVTLF